MDQKIGGGGKPGGGLPRVGRGGGDDRDVFGAFRREQAEQISGFIGMKLRRAKAITVTIPIISGHPHKVWYETDDWDGLTNGYTEAIRDKIERKVMKAIQDYGDYILNSGNRDGELVITATSNGEVRQKRRRTFKIINNGYN